MIAFLGSVFSPWYRRALSRPGGADPLAHACLHATLSGPRARAWAMTERGAGAVRRSAAHLAIGPSALSWDGETLLAEIDERCAPIPSRLRGRLRVRPRARTGYAALLDPAGRHRWRPIAPRTDVALEFDAPSVRWRGQGYLDSNDGDAPLSEDFSRWDWAAAPADEGAAILYDRVLADGSERRLALRIGGNGAAEPFEPRSRPRAIGRTSWGLDRRLRAEDDATVTDEMLVSAPFYARSRISARLLGARRTAMHETLDLERFARFSTQAMLPFRNPRR